MIKLLYDSERYLFITCNAMKSKGLPVNNKFLLNGNNVYIDLLNRARALLGTEAKDLGDEFASGGTVIDDYGLKTYTRMLLGDSYNYLKDTNGKICRDVPHFILAREIMRGQGRDSDDLSKVSALSIIASAPYLRDVYLTLSKSKDKKVFKPNIYQSLSDFSCTKFPFVFDRFMIYLLTSEGYTSYIYEPMFTSQMMFLVNVCNMPMEEAHNYVNKSRDSGLLISGIPMWLENKLSETIYSGGVLNLDGYFKSAYYKAFDKLKNVAGSDRSVYKSSIKPQMLKLFGEVIKLINVDLAQSPDIRVEDCYVNHISPRRLSICVRSDLNISEILPNVGSKFMKFSLQEFNLLNYALGGEY